MGCISFIIDVRRVHDEIGVEVYVKESVKSLKMV